MKKPVFWSCDKVSSHKRSSCNEISNEEKILFQSAKRVKLSKKSSTISVSEAETTSNSYKSSTQDQLSWVDQLSISNRDNITDCLANFFIGMINYKKNLKN